MSEVKNVRPKKSRKDIIKDITIAFLAVLLLLTFFSNTIMNYSLPEVAIQQVQEGTISPVVRAEGAVEAKEPYMVKVSQERVIKSVAVEKGAEVKKGDVIYYLEDKESSELIEARTKLDELMQTFETSLFSGDLSNEAINRVRNGQTLTMDQLQAKLKAATDRYDAAKLADEEAQAAIDEQNQDQAYTAAQYNYDEATPQYREADITYRITELDQQIEAAKADTESTSTDESDAKDEYDNAKKDRDSKKTAWESAKAAVDTTKEAYAKAEAAYNNVKDNPSITEAEKVTKKTAMDQAKIEMDSAPGKVDTAKAAYDKAKETVEKKKKAYEKAQNTGSLKKTANESLVETLEAEKNRLLLEQANGTKDVSQMTTQAGQVDYDYQRKSASLQDIKNKTSLELDRASTDKTELITEISKEIELDGQRDTIEEQKETIEKLEKESIGATITAPVDGKISDLALKAGETTNAENAVAQIQIAGKGMQMTASIPMDQAKRIKVGDIAEPTNSWYFTDFKASVKSISADANNPNTKKSVVFAIESTEVQDGQTIKLQIGGKSDSYDLTIPLGAVRKDSNGEFILIVKAKSSPLGNRYIASRVDVQTVASDDTTAAITGSLEGDEYVITTSTTLIKSGDQVRLANNQ